MILWIFIMAALLIVFAAAIIYLSNRFRKFQVVKRFAKGKKWLERTVSLALVALLIAVFWITMNFMNAVIVLLHLVVFWLLCDFGAYIFRRITKKEFPKSYAGVLAMIFTAIYLCIGWYLANNVWRTEYQIATDKDIGKVRLVLFSDSHVGTTFDGDDWEQYIDRMNAENPDVVLIAGDFVDDDTQRDDMIKSCKAMGQLKTKYGAYYAFGNHDKGYYEASRRGYDSEELIAELEKNHVTVLQDENVLIDSRFYIIGRKDRSEEQQGSQRADMESLVKDLDASKFSIVMDHQPYDYDGEEKAQVDMVLSGHTHGGQFIPINDVGEWTGENAKSYGYEKRDRTNFIVTSGISDWAFKFKTGCKSEYVVIDIHEEV